MPKKILVTGGTGFVGTALRSFLPDAQFVGRAAVNLVDSQATLAYFADAAPDVVIHMAARVGGITANISHPADFLLDNVRIDANVCAAVRTLRPQHFIALLSTCMYPEQLDAIHYPMSEDLIEAGPPPPTNAAYASAKRTLSHACRALQAQYGIGYTCLVPANLYGPHDHFGSTTSHFLAAAITRVHEARLARRSRIDFFGTGRAMRQYVYVDDVAWAIRRLVEVGPMNCLLNIAPAVSASIAALAQAVADAGGYRGAIGFTQAGPDGQLRKDASPKRLHAMLPDWQTHETSLVSGLQTTFEWYARRLSTPRSTCAAH